MDMFNSQLEYLDELDYDMKNSILYYTGLAYDILNLNMRNGDPSEEIDIKHIDNLLEMFDKIPVLTQAITVYRGSGCIDEFEEVDFVDNAFVSTTLDEKMSDNFANGCILVISVPAGMKVLPVWKISGAPEEKEVILQPRTRFVKIKESKNGRNKIIYYTCIYM
jgi:hypothetical protein